MASVRLMAAGGSFLSRPPVDERPEPPCVNASPAPAPWAPPSDPSLNLLTDREREVLSRLSAGRANKLIAYDLKISEGTVKAHLRNIMRKLHATNRTQAAMRFNAAMAALVKREGSAAKSK